MPQYNEPPLITSMAGADIILVWQTSTGAVRTITYADLVAGIASGGSNPPGGVPQNLQFNNAGVFGGVPVANWDGANLTLTSPIILTPSGLVKGDVGLGNVDNTSDLTKPISTATQSALDLKAPIASPGFTGIPAAPTAALHDSSTQIATTAFVLNELAGYLPISGVTAASVSFNNAIKGALLATSVQAAIDELTKYVMKLAFNSAGPTFPEDYIMTQVFQTLQNQAFNITPTR